MLRPFSDTTPYKPVYLSQLSPAAVDTSSHTDLLPLALPVHAKLQAHTEEWKDQKGFRGPVRFINLPAWTQSLLAWRCHSAEFCLFSVKNAHKASLQLTQKAKYKHISQVISLI